MVVRTLAVACGGAVGAVMRYWLQIGVHHWLGQGFPYGTLAVNAVGSFSMGFLYVQLVERGGFSLELRAALVVGLLGAFTTFSTFSFETLELLESGALARALLNVVVSVLGCIGLCWMGLVLARQL